MTEQAGVGEFSGNGVAEIGRLYQMIFSYPISQIITTAVRLGLPDRLAGPAAPAGSLATAVGASERSLRRLLRALTALGITAELEPDRFALTALGRFLQSDAPGSVHAPALLAGHPVMWQAWGSLEQTVRQGSPGFEQVFGQPLFSYLADHRDLGELFNSVLAARTQAVVPQIAANFDFSLCGRVMDVGGGDGTLLAAILAAYPAVTGVLMDKLETAEAASKILAAQGLASRCDIETGDFFESIPGGCDTYVLKNILHDWSDEQAAIILRNCRSAVPADGRLLVMTMLRDDQPASDPVSGMGAAVSEMEMMLLTHGGERTIDEYARLFEEAHFRHSGTHLVAHYPDYYVIELHPQ